MTASSLDQALMEEAGIQSVHQLDDQQRVWFDYASSFNRRGTELVRTLEDNFSGSLKGKRVLDIGCGFGGCAIAAARRGARVVGVDLSERNLRLARQNLNDFPLLDIVFENVDITQPGVAKEYGPFDLIIADNVIEHVSCPAKLIASASAMLAPAGHLYVTAPNARSTQMVGSECHYGMLGASLLSPRTAESLLNVAATGDRQAYEVSYYLDFGQYRNLFIRYGLQPVSLLPESATAEALVQLKADVASTLARIQGAEWRIHRDLVLEAAARWKDEFDADWRAFEFHGAPAAQSVLAGLMVRDYSYALWYFVAKK